MTKFSIRFLVLFWCLGWASPLWAAKYCLWKISGEQNSVYLLGSIHFLEESFYPLAEPIEGAFEEAEKVVFETDMAQMSQPQAQMKMLMQGVCPPDKTIADFLSKETYAVLQKRLGDQAGVLERFQPWLAAVTLVALEVQKMGFDPEQGVDQYFYRKATKAGKKTSGLETVQFQMDLFTSLTRKDQEQLLKETLTEMEQIRGMLDETIQAWKTGDVAKLEEILLAAMKEYPEVERKFLTDRNRQWVPKIEGYLSGTEDVLVVVGAAHLIGGDSVVDQLRKRGHKVTQQAD